MPSGDKEVERVRFGPTFAACSTARPLLFICALTLSGTGSIVALGAGLTDALQNLHPRISDWIETICIVSFVGALFLSVVGTISVIIHGMDRSGEVVIRGTRYRGSSLSRFALSIFALPWIVLGIMIAFYGLR